MAALLHLDDLIRRLQLDRRRCFVITGRPREGKTHLAERMAARYNGQRLDVLAIFAADPDLTASVDVFTPRRFRDFLEPYATGDLVLVDEMEFLWHRWDDSEKEEFLTILERWSRAFFGVFLPPHPVIEGFTMLDQDRRPRIFSLYDLQGL